MPPARDEPTPSPYNYIYQPRDPEQTHLVTTLMQSSEDFADLWREPVNGTEVNCAAGNEALSLLFPEDSGSLIELAKSIQDWIHAEPHRATLLESLCVSLEEGELLRVIFRNLFPQQSSHPVLDREGKPILSEREVEILREIAGDRTREQIALRLNISSHTVKRHLDNIYEKLGVHRPMQAVARAVGLRYLDLDALDLTQHAGSTSFGNTKLFGAYIDAVGRGVSEQPEAKQVQHMAVFGLLLYILSAGGGRQLVVDGSYAQEQAGAMIALANSEGAILREFALPEPGSPQGLAVAPAHAERHGFTPGHLYVAYLLPKQRKLNSFAIAELTQEGQYRGSFCGGSSVATRLVNRVSLAFGPDGRLLATSAYLTDSILAFEDGGRRVERFAEGCCTQIAVHKNRVYAAQVSSLGSVVRVWDSKGVPLAFLAPSEPGIAYNGVAVNSQGHLRVGHYLGNDLVIETYCPEDAGTASVAEPLRISGLVKGYFTIDEQDRLLIICRKTQDIKIMAANGCIERALRFPQYPRLRCVTPTLQGRFYLCFAGE